MNKPEVSASFALGRRDLVLAATAALVVSSRQASAQAPAVPPNVVFDDKLAVPLPVPADRSLGRGKDRAMALGGGGEYFAAWMLGFAHGLHAEGVPYEMPDVIVGTSAGSVVGSTIAGGHLERLTREFDFFGDFPRILAALVPTPKPNPGQCARSTSAEPSATAASRPSNRSAAAPWRQETLRSPSFRT
jgi:NTE family protein